MLRLNVKSLNAVKSFMDEAKRKLVQSWLRKAKRDLATARKLSEGPEPYLDTAIYHCQQAAEKSVKGFPVFHDCRFEKTHELTTLIASATKLNNQFSSWADVGEDLTPYVVAFRYPGEIEEPEDEEFGHALEIAEKFFNFVLSSLPKEVHP